MDTTNMGKIPSMLLISLNLILILPDTALAMARPPGWGGGRGGSGGSGASGSPLPLLGGTILGQGAVVGGAIYVWRRIRKRK